MSDPSLFTDGQVALLASAIGGGLALIGGAVRQGFKSYAKSFQEMTETFKAVVGKLGTQTETLIKLEAVIEEGRDDIREIRDTVALKRPSRPIRAQTPPKGSGRLATEEP